MSLRDDYRQRGRASGGRYQGKEFTTHFQANSEAELDEMLREVRKASERMGTGPVKVHKKGRDPDGGYEAIVSAHNWNPLKWVKERLGKDKEEEEFKKRRKRGEVDPEELSPREQRDQIETGRKRSEEAAKAAERARGEERRRAPRLAREAIEASEEGRKAEERAKLLETELYGAPLKGPEEVIRDRWGKEIGRKPLTAKRREEAAKLELAHQRMTQSGLELIEERFKTAKEEVRGKRVAKRREKVMGPVRGVARAVAGTVEAVGKGMPSVRTEPYRPVKMPSPLPTPRSIEPTGAPIGGPTPRPKSMDLSHLRNLQSQSVRVGSNRQSKVRNTYNEQMRRLRRQLYGG